MSWAADGLDGNGLHLEKDWVNVLSLSPCILENSLFILFENSLDVSSWCSMNILCLTKSTCTCS